MIIGTGVDIVDINRIQDILTQSETRFLNRTYTAFEQKNAPHDPAARGGYFAKRYAAKEAFVKAIGTGFRDGISFLDMCVKNDPLGKPILSVTGAAADRLSALTPHDHGAFIHLSLSDTNDTAIAFVVIDCLKAPS